MANKTPCTSMQNAHFAIIRYIDNDAYSNPKNKEQMIVEYQYFYNCEDFEEVVRTLLEEGKNFNAIYATPIRAEQKVEFNYPDNM